MLKLKMCLVPCRIALSSYRPKIQLNFFSSDGIAKKVPNKANFKDVSPKKATNKTPEKPEESNNVKKWLKKYELAPNSIIQKKIKSYLVDGNIKRAIELHSHQTDEFQLNFLDHLQLINGALEKGWLFEAQHLLGKMKRDEVIFWGNDSTRAVINIFTSLALQKASLSEIRDFERIFFSQKSVPPQVFETIMHYYLMNYGDIAAFDLFKRIAAKFKQTCCQQKLLCQFIENESVNEIEELLTISSSIHTRNNSIKSLAMALIECGQIDQAKKLFESQKINDNDLQLRASIDFHWSRGDEQLLKGMLTALENCNLPRMRKQIYTSLLKMYEKKGDLDELKNLVFQMDAEQMIPYKGLRRQVVGHFRKSGLDVPESWCGDNDYGSQLECLLKSDQIEDANKLLCKLLEEEKAQPISLLNYFFLKNSEKGILSMFVYLRDKFDDHTKQQLQLYAYECDAYRNAGEPEEYVKILRQTFLTLERGSKKYLIKTFTDNIIEMISQYPDIYDEYKKLATEIADKGLLKPICILWAYNFINGVNDSDNELIWKKYFTTKSTFICSKIPRILYNRKETKRLREFLNLKTLNKLYISPLVIGESYGLLFNALINYNEDYDTVILELKKVMHYISKNDLNAATKNVLKSGPREITDKIYTIMNSNYY